MDNLYLHKTAIILYAEDNPADQRLTLKAFNKSKVKTDLRIVNDGQEALDYLEHKGEYADQSTSPLPDLILLDINMPLVDGKEVLKYIRESDRLNTLPVIMLTTSDYEKDILESYKLGVNAYVSKPIKVEDFFAAILRLENFWMN
ncbi:MAG: response regulator, partial [Bacteroidota bacterium]